MRSAKDQEYFPYDAKTICYILIYKDGTVKQVQHIKSDLTEAYNLVNSNLATLYAVWPGNYRSDLFLIDDLDQFADTNGIPRKDNHVHKLEWKISNHDNGTSRYALVDCKFKCNCSFIKMGIKKFALDMREQSGWVVATSTGCGISGDEFTVSVARSSLKNKTSD